MAHSIVELIGDVYRKYAAGDLAGSPEARNDAIGMRYLIPGRKFDNKRPCMVRYSNLLEEVIL